MNLLNLNWNIILENIISNLSVGLILGLVGYFIWKKQHHYKKGEELYNKLMPLIGKLEVYLELSFQRKLTKRDLDNIAKLFEELYPLTEEIKINFGNIYANSLTELYHLLDDCTNDERCSLSEEEFNIYVKRRSSIFIPLGEKYRKK